MNINTNQGFPMIDFSGLNMNMNNNFNTQASIPISPLINNSEPVMTQIFKNNEIVIYSSLIKNPDKINVNGSFFISNSIDKTINNLKMNLSVKKHVNCKVISTSGSVLEPNKSLGIKKVNRN